MSKLFVPLVLALATVGEAAPPPPIPPVPTPSLVTDVNNGINVDIRINDLPLTRHELAQTIPVPNQIIEVPPYYFHAGTNTITLRYVANLKGYPDSKMDIAVTQVSTGKVLAKINPTKFTGCDTGDFDKRCELTVKFEVAADPRLPVWKWTTGTKITDTPANRKSLIAAYVELHKQLGQLVPRDDDGKPKRPPSKAGLAQYRAGLSGKMADLAKSAALQNAPIVELDELVYLVAHKDSSLDYMRLDADDTKVEIFGDGTHARLWQSRIPLIWFKGGAHDAPRGTLGPFSIGFDVWFRLIDGKWVPSAIWRTDPMVSLP